MSHTTCHLDILIVHCWLKRRIFIGIYRIIFYYGGTTFSDLTFHRNVCEFFHYDPDHHKSDEIYYKQLYEQPIHL